MEHTQVMFKISYRKLLYRMTHRLSWPDPEYVRPLTNPEIINVVVNQPGQFNGKYIRGKYDPDPIKAQENAAEVAVRWLIDNFRIQIEDISQEEIQQLRTWTAYYQKQKEGLLSLNSTGSEQRGMNISDTQMPSMFVSIDLNQLLEKILKSYSLIQTSMSCQRVVNNGFVCTSAILNLRNGKPRQRYKGKACSTVKSAKESLITEIILHLKYGFNFRVMDCNEIFLKSELAKFQKARGRYLKLRHELIGSEPEEDLGPEARFRTMEAQQAFFVCRYSRNRPRPITLVGREMNPSTLAKKKNSYSVDEKWM